MARLRPQAPAWTDRGAGWHYKALQAQAAERQPRDVWAWNLDAEFDELLNAVARERSPVLALDTEFPGFLREDQLHASRTARYRTLRQNVDHLRPIQVGLAVGGPGGSLRGTWTFNLWFDLSTEWYTEESVWFLSAAGVDFPRHATEGIDPDALAWRLTRSPLLGGHIASPQWVTFSGWYDWGYMLKLLTGQPLPSNLYSYERLLDALCPSRQELRDHLPRGSLDGLLAAHGVERCGLAHTAGSDALATLELFLYVCGSKMNAPIHHVVPTLASGDLGAEVGVSSSKWVSSAEWTDSGGVPAPIVQCKPWGEQEPSQDGDVTTAPSATPLLSSSPASTPPEPAHAGSSGSEDTDGVAEAEPPPRKPGKPRNVSVVLSAISVLVAGFCYMLC
mmetsp:Transcript_132424/g.342577  ORF Transcript_132424/g.342577 Transcript_132424/m.342577 type:complete len:391 (-) Transcript_132424:85-1257(-)